MAAQYDGDAVKGHSALLIVAGKPKDDEEDPSNDNDAKDKVTSEDGDTDAHYEQMEKDAYAEFKDAIKNGDDEAGMAALRQFVSICSMHGAEESGESEKEEAAEA